MSNHLKLRAAAIFCVLIICIVALGIFLASTQTSVAIDEQSESLRTKIEQMETIVEDAQAEAAADQQSYDEVYQAKATTVAYIAQHSSTFEATDRFCADLAARMNVSNILLLDADGQVIASGSESPADFTRARFNQLRTVFSTDEPSEAFTVDFGSESYRYFAARINENTEVVVENDPAELTELLDLSSSWASILGSISVGLDGYAFAVSSQDYTILYHPDSDLVGNDVSDVGIDVEDLEEGWFGWMDIDGVEYYCGVTQLEDSNAYVICAIPGSEITSASTVTIVIVLAVFSIVMILIAAYAVMVAHAEERRGDEGVDKEKTYKKFGRIIYNRTIGSKSAVIAGVGLLSVIVCAFYMQTLFSISSHSASNQQRVEEVQQAVTENDATVESLTAQYNRRYLNKCQMASYILSANPDLINRDDLIEMAEALGVDHLFVFDDQGDEVASDSSYVNFSISDNPEDQSYAFNVLLRGVEYVIQEAQADEVSGTYAQYIGVPLYDESGTIVGIVQISVVPDKLEDALASTTLNAVLGGVHVGTNGFAFAVSVEDKTFTYYPDSRLVGRDVTSYGIEESQLKDGFSDFLSIDAKRYYASSVEIDGNYIYVAIPEAEMTSNRLSATLSTGVASLICLVILFLLSTLSIERDPSAVSKKNSAAKPVVGMVETKMPDGSKRLTQSASSRWSGKKMPWSSKTPEQKIGLILKAMIALLALCICLCVLFGDSVVDQNSALAYVLGGAWEHTPSIFSLTACLMVACVTGVLTMAIHEVLRYLSKAFGPRGVTVCRLLGSAVKYVGVLVGLFICLSLLGVDTTTLLASLGILSLVLGLGAQSLISDILAGLFIIFEGEFRVGDIVTIGDWRGTVLEIGVRTTKIESGGHDVKIFSNSAISGVINMTKNYSIAAVEIGFDYEESIERVESVLARELPKLKDRLPAIIDGPVYNGVTLLDDSSVTIRISATCQEKDRIALMRSLNRELKIIFDDNDINIPFPQVTVRKPKEYANATAYERHQARKFSEEQKVASASLGKEEED